jgi:transcriptional regulator with XRE-family HTH domain
MPRRKTDPRRADAVDVAAGRNVRFWRVARGLSQTALADRLGVTFQQVQKYESGSNRLSIGRLVKAAGALDVPLSALMGDAKDSAQSAPALIRNSGAFRLAHAFAALKGSKFRKLRESLATMVEKLAAFPQKRKRRRRVRPVGRPSRRAE